MKDWSGNSNSIYKTLGASNHTEEDREEDDYYIQSVNARQSMCFEIKIKIDQIIEELK